MSCGAGGLAGGDSRRHLTEYHAPASASARAPLGDPGGHPDMGPARWTVHRAGPLPDHCRTTGRGTRATGAARCQLLGIRTVSMMWTFALAVRTLPQTTSAEPFTLYDSPEPDVVSSVFSSVA